MNAYCTGYKSHKHPSKHHNSPKFSPSKAYPQNGSTLHNFASSLIFLILASLPLAKAPDPRYRMLCLYKPTRHCYIRGPV